MHPRILAGLVFDLAELDPVPAQLHLEIDPPDILDLAVFVIPRQVPGPVHLLPGQEAARTEFLRRQLLPLPVAKADLHASQAELSRDPLRQQMPVRIADKGVRILDRPPDGHVRLVSLYFIQSDEGSAFRWTVDIVNMIRCLPGGQQLLPAYRHARERQVVIIDQGAPHLGGHEGMGDMVVTDIGRDPVRILPQLLRQDVRRGTGRQGTEAVYGRAVEGEAGMHQVHRILAVPELFVDPLREGPETALAVDGAFGLSCGTGGVDHVDHAVPVRKIDGRGSLVFPDCLQHKLLRQDQLRLAVLKDILDTFFRILQVHGHIAGAGFVDAQSRDDKLLHTAHFDRDEAVLYNALPDQVRCHGVGLAVQLRIGHAAPAVDDGRLVRMLFRLREEQVHPGLPFVGHILSLRKGKDVLRFLVIKQRNIGKTILRQHPA